MLDCTKCFPNLVTRYSHWKDKRDAWLYEKVANIMGQRQYGVAEQFGVSVISGITGTFSAAVVVITTQTSYSDETKIALYILGSFAFCSSFIVYYISKVFFEYQPNCPVNIVNGKYISKGEEQPLIH